MEFEFVMNIAWVKHYTLGGVFFLFGSMNQDFSFLFHPTIEVPGRALPKKWGTGISLIVDRQKYRAQRMMGRLRVTKHQSENIVFTLSGPIIPCALHFGDQQ